MKKYFVFTAEGANDKLNYLATKQLSLPSGSFFACTANQKLATVTQSNVRNQVDQKLNIEVCRPVYITETNLENLFADLTANAEFVTDNANELQNYLNQID